MNIDATFVRYVLVGCMNTAVHWLSFMAVYYGLSWTQAQSNVFGFALAVTFSFFVNARLTFKTKASARRYLLFTGFMGLLAYAQGALATYLGLPFIVTLIVFSASSLVLGYLYAKYIVFRA